MAADARLKALDDAEKELGNLKAWLAQCEDSLERVRLAVKALHAPDSRVRVGADFEDSH